MATQTTVLNLTKPAGNENALISVINSNMDSLDAEAGKVRANVAADYSDSSAYAVGDLCVHDGSLYRCNTAIGSGGETWNAAHWTQVSIAGQLSALNSKIPNPVNTSSGFDRSEIFGSSSSNIMILRSYLDSGSDYLQFVLHANNGRARLTKSVGGTETTLMELALKSDVKKKTYTNVTTSASGNVSFEDLLTTNTIVLAVVCTTDAASVCIPYRNNATYNRWGAHVITDNATSTVKTNTTLSLEVYYLAV